MALLQERSIIETRTPVREPSNHDRAQRPASNLDAREPSSMPCRPAAADHAEPGGADHAVTARRCIVASSGRRRTSLRPGLKVRCVIGYCSLGSTLDRSANGTTARSPRRTRTGRWRFRSSTTRCGKRQDGRIHVFNKLSMAKIRVR